MGWGRAGRGSVSGSGTAGSPLRVLGDFRSCQVGSLQLFQPSNTLIERSCFLLVLAGVCISESTANCYPG